MSTLKHVEKTIFEYLFGMGEGCVLNFSDSSFRDFFNEHQINIDSKKYIIPTRSTSKANRLRTFWDLEPDPIVGKILSELLEYYNYCPHIEKIEKHNSLYPQAEKIIARMLSSPIDTEIIFLTEEFGYVSFKELNLKSIVIKIIEERFKEVNNCLNGNAFLAAIILKIGRAHV